MRKTLLLVNVRSGEEFGSEIPWARGVHGEGFGRKALDGAGKSKKCKNVAIARKLSAYSACQHQLSSVPITVFLMWGLNARGVCF